MFRGTALAAPLAVLWCAVSASAQTVLTVDRVLELAASQNPEVLVARARVAQAEGSLTTARARFSTNPDVDMFIGSRDTLPGDRLGEYEFSIVQRFELGGQRGHRVAAATAAIDQRTQEANATALEAQLLALAALYRAVHATEIRRVAASEFSVAEEAVRAAHARYDTGETAVLDVNVSRVELARAKRSQLTAASRLEAALGELRAILALPAQERLQVEAPLAVGAPPPVDVLLSRLSDRPDVRALGAALAQAEAELRLAGSTRRPDLLGGVGFVREEGEPVIGARIGMSLPLFQKPTGAVATASGRVSELKIALETKRVSLAARLQSAHTRYAMAAEAADAIATTATPLVDDNERLTRDSYQAGKIGLLELLVIRREGFAARREALDAQLEASLAALEVRGIAGVIR